MKLGKYFILFIVLCVSLVTNASTIIVTNGSQSGAGSLQDAINSATDGDSIVINFKGAFAIGTPVVIDNLNNITIIGPYAKHMFFQGDNSGTTSYIEIKNSTNIELWNLGFWNPLGGFNAIRRAVDVDSSSTATFFSCLFEGCQPSTGDGGAIRVRNNSGIRVVSSSFINNSSEDSGGAIALDSTFSSANIQSSTFYDNKCTTGKGGAVYVAFASNTNSLVFNGNTFHSNAAENIVGDVSGHAVFVDYNSSTSIFAPTYCDFRNNLLYLNGFQGQAQMIYPNLTYAGNFNSVIQYNYYFAFNSATTLPARFVNNSSPDYWGFSNLLTGIGIRTTFVTDGYGLKYFTIVDGSSPLIDVGTSSSVAVTTDNRRNRAPRIMDGDLDGSATIDVGAVEYTPYRVVGSPGPAAWWDLVSNGANPINGSPNPGDVHYIEFDITDPNLEVTVHQNTPSIERTVYVDGYSQDGSAIPGSNNVSIFTTNTDTLTAARDLVTFISLSTPAANGIELNAANSTIAGLSLVDFSEYGILLEEPASNASIFGNVIGIQSNIATGLAVIPTPGNEYGGVLVKSDNVTIGGSFHHQRNVISGNGYDAPNGTPDYYGANIHKASTADDLTIIGNVIGLHPNGKDVIPSQSTAPKLANGIYADDGQNLTIGGAYLFSKNVISDNAGSGIFHTNASTGNVVDNNLIGVNYDGRTALGNQYGIYLKNALGSYAIGGGIGNIISANDSAGVRIVDGQSIRIFGNIIGGDSTLTSNAFGNDKGIHITGNSGSSATPIRIGNNGYDIANERNIIINNNIGVYLSGDDVEDIPVKGNLIGVSNANAVTALPNVVGIKLDSGANDNYIGYDPTSGIANEINIIAGNTDAGVWFDGELTNDNRIASNIIGGTIPLVGTALQPLGNGVGVRFTEIENGSNNYIGNESDNDLKLVIIGNETGIEMSGSAGAYIFNSYIGIDTNDNIVENNFGIHLMSSDSVTIGGSSTKSNVISGNDSIGVLIQDSKRAIVAGNYIGTDKGGVLARPNEIGIRIKLGGNHLIGQTDRNVISGNRIGIGLDSTILNEVRNNYFGLTADGLSVVTDSKYGIVGKNLFGSNDFGQSSTAALGRNYFATDSIGITINSSKLQKVINNVIGYQIDGTSLLGTAQTGVGIFIKDSEYIRVGAPTPAIYGGNTIANQLAGIRLVNADSVQIQYTNFGTDVSGTAVTGIQNQRVGIFTRGVGGSEKNIIGPNNVFGGNRVGIALGNLDNENEIFQNYFGIDTALTDPNAVNFRNDTALYLFNADNNYIGASGDSANQFINYIHGIVLRTNADSNVFVNNFIGRTSNNDTGSNLGNGIVIDNSFGNRIGSSDLSDVNTITNNNGSGISVVNNSSGNAFLRNAIYLNNSLGIDIGGNNIFDNTGVTGFQDELHVPVLNHANPCTGTNIDVEVTVDNVVPGETYFIDVYTANGDTLDADGYGEGGKSIFFSAFIPTSSPFTTAFNLTSSAVIGDTLVAILTRESTGSSTEFGKYNIVQPPPQNATITELSELCENAFAGGRIQVDNTINSSYQYDVLLNTGVQFQTTAANMFEEDSLTPGGYTVEIVYNANCSFNYPAVLSVGPTFDVGIASTVSDTCSIGTGSIELSVINNGISPNYTDTLYSFDNGATYGQPSVLGSLNTGDIITSHILLNVTNGGVSEVCPASDTIDFTIGSHTIPTGDLTFTYGDFCSDINGTLSSAPSFSDGSYSFNVVPALSTAAINASTGQITNAEDNDSYTISYNYGTCAYTHPTVTAFDVPSPAFTMTDFCANGASSVPLPNSAGGTFSLISQPGSETINSSSGEIVLAGMAYTAGNYNVAYNTNDADCPRISNETIEVYGIPVPITLTAPAESNVYDSEDTDADSITFCPNTGSNIITSSELATTWVLPGGSTINASTYPVNLAADDSSYYLNYFYNTPHTGANPSTLECTSNPDSVFIEVYKTAVKPDIVNGDAAYCETSPVLGLIITNSAATNSVNWFLDNNLSPPVATSNSYSITGPYDNALRTIYAQDSTGLGCNSEFDTTELIFFSRPENVDLTYLSPIANGDTIRPCPSYNDTIFGNSPSVLENVYWDTIGGTLISSNIFIPNDNFGSDVTKTVYAYKDSLFNTGFTLGGPASVTCESLKDTITIDISKSPVLPIILADSISYCLGETIDSVTVDNFMVTNNVLWYENTKSDVSFLSNPSDSHFVAPTYDDQSFFVFARDSTGVNCYSDFDSIKITFHQVPDLPVLKINEAANDTVFPSEIVDLCPVSFDSIMSNTSDQHTIWQINTLPNDTSNYFGEPYPLGLSTLRYFGDTLYTNTNTYCRSNTDSIYLNILEMPINTSFANAAYCEDELPVDLMTSTGANLVWTNISLNDTLRTITPHQYTPTVTAYDNRVDTIVVYDSTGVTTLGVECVSTVNDTVQIAYHSKPDTSEISLFSTGALSTDTTLICPTISDSLIANTNSAETYWYTQNNQSVIITDSILDISSFVPNSDSTIFNYTSVEYNATVAKVCFSDTNLRVVSTFGQPNVPVTLAQDTAYCEGEIIDSLEVIGGVSVVWNETGSGPITTFGPHKYLQTIPAVFDNSVDTVVFNNLLGITTAGDECKSENDTIKIAYNAKPTAASVTVFSTGLSENDTTFICPTSTDSLMANTIALETFWYTENNQTSTVNDSILDISAFAPNSDSTIYNYIARTYNNLVSKTCASDTNSRVVRTYKTPQVPAILSDSSYCFGEAIDSMAIDIIASNVTSIKWGDLSTAVTDSATVSPFKYNPTNVVYDGFAKTVYAIDYTGVGCFSDTGKAFLSFHQKPAVPALTLNNMGPNIPSGDTVWICPTDVSNFLQSNTSETDWYGDNIISQDAQYNLAGQGPLVMDTVKAVSSMNHSVVSDITCYSDTTIAIVATYGTPVQPSITSAGLEVDSVLYCDNDVINNLGVFSGDLVNWFQVNEPGSDSTNVNIYNVTQLPPFNSQTDIYVAYDSTGIGCVSENDSIYILFYPRPAPPILSIGSNSFCEDETILSIFSTDVNSIALISDWYVNDTTLNSVQLGAGDYMPTYDFAADTVFNYYAQTQSDIGCYSYFSQVGVAYHPTPDLPSINYAGTGLQYCPEDALDTLFSDSLLTWYYDPAVIAAVNDTFDLNTVTLNPGIDTTIKYFYTDIYNCDSDTGIVGVEIFDIPIEPVLFTGDYTYCLGDQTIDAFVAAEANSDPLVGVGSWYDINGNLLTSGGPNSFNYGLAPPLLIGDTSIIFNYLDVNNCLSINDTITIETFPIPQTPSISTLDSVYCEGESFFDLSETNGVSTNWYRVISGVPNLLLSDNSVYTPVDSGTYIIITIENECESIPDSIEVIINALPPTPVIADMQIEYCSDEEVDTIFIESGSNGQWYESSDLNTTISASEDFYLPVMTITDSVQYFVNVLDVATECYSLFDSITLYQFISLGSITTELAELCEGYSQEITAEGGASYLWSTLDTTASISVSPDVSTWYFVDIVDENDCKSRDSLEVILKLPASCAETVYTAFSPNGDGVNEFWDITGIEKYDNPTVYIFNRWGDQIAKISDYDNVNNVWDGINQNNGAPVVYGTYYYIIEDGTTKVQDGWLQVVK